VSDSRSHPKCERCPSPGEFRVSVWNDHRRRGWTSILCGEHVKAYDPPDLRMEASVHHRSVTVAPLHVG
jgi:hypothetical protein